MRKLLIWSLVLGTLAVVVAELMHRNDGYAIVALSQHHAQAKQQHVASP